MKRTVKQDWFTNYLYSKGFWVGGTRVNIPGHPELVARQTYRYFRASTTNFLVIYILEFAEAYNNLRDYESIIKILHSKLIIPTGFVLGIWPREKATFSIYKNGRYYGELNDEQALAHFAEFDRHIIGKSQNLKPLNKSFTDFFHMWARSNMKGFQNDIDSFLSTSKGTYMLELKRPKESVSTWRPYKADTHNYTQFSQYTQAMQYKLINIAYSLEEPGKIKIFKNIEVSKSGALIYKTNLIAMEPQDDLMILIENTEMFEEISNR